MFEIREADGLQMPELEIFTKLRENQLAHIFEPDPGLFIAESPKVIERALRAGYRPYAALMETGQLAGEAGAVLRNWD